MVVRKKRLTRQICAKAPALLHTIAFGPPVQRSNIEKGKQHVHITMKMILTSQTHWSQLLLYGLFEPFLPCPSLSIIKRQPKQIWLMQPGVLIWS